MSDLRRSRRVDGGRLRLVPRAITAIERRLPASTLSHLLERVASSRVLAPLYATASATFSGEMRAVLAGRAKHAEADAALTQPIYEVRRDTHRLEKGLCSESRRDVFGTAYVAQLVGGVEAIVAARAASGERVVDATVSSSLDVLNEYFSAVPRVAETENSRRRFSQLLETLGYAPKQRSPRKSKTAEPAVSLEQFEQLVLSRQSVRVFEPRPVDRILLDRAFELALWSPSACNRHAYEFRVYDDPATIRAIVALTSGMSGWAEHAPCLIVVTGKYRAYSMERDRHLIYVDTGLAAMTLQYALVVQDLACCCGNWPEDAPNDQRLAGLLSLADDEKPTLLLAVGHPRTGQRVPSSSRPELESMRSFNREIPNSG